MNNVNPAQATPLEHPPAALNAHTRPPPHHDSEEAVQYERRRVSRELEPIVHHSSSRQSTGTTRLQQATPSFASLRSRNASTSREHLTRHASAISGASTQPDIPGASEDGGQSSRSALRVPHWYDPIVGFWTRHICPTIDEGAFRDHLGMFTVLLHDNSTLHMLLYMPYFYLTFTSARTHLPRLSPHLSHTPHDRRPCRTALPPPTHREPESRFRLLCHWIAAQRHIYCHGSSGATSWSGEVLEAAESIDCWESICWRVGSTDNYGAKCTSK